LLESYLPPYARFAPGRLYSVASPVNCFVVAGCCPLFCPGAGGGLFCASSVLSEFCCWAYYFCFPELASGGITDTSATSIYTWV
jgi:hypothetical protein